jgi:hypothetical protein
MNAAVDTLGPQTSAKQTTMGELKPAPQQLESSLPALNVGFTSLQSFQLIWRVSQMFASSSIVPQRFQGNPPNCAIALEMAHRLGASPLMVMQNLYVVHGNPGWSAKFLIACFNQCGRFTSIKYKFQGTEGKDDWGCRAWATEKLTGEKVEGPLITIGLAKKEGWYSKNGSKWQSMPEQMLRYRSGAWMINTVAPEISMGLRTEDELQDMGALEARRDAAGGFAVDLESLRTAPPANAGDQQPADGRGQNAPDIKEWVASFNACHTLDELTTTWQKFIDSLGDGEVPDECDAAFQTRRDALTEEEGRKTEQRSSTQAPSDQAKSTGKGGKAGKLDL